jgi:hypothetical protein
MTKPSQRLALGCAAGRNTPAETRGKSLALALVRQPDQLGKRNQPDGYRLELIEKPRS